MRIMRDEDYGSYVAFHKRNEAVAGICPEGTKILLMFYYGALIGAFAMLGKGELAHLLIDRDYRGRGFGTILGAIATFLAGEDGHQVWTQYRNREVYAKLYAELGYRQAELIEMEKAIA